eukprot:4448276-Lingulodinium_polyedra.AAC.1
MQSGKSLGSCKRGSTHRPPSDFGRGGPRPGLGRRPRAEPTTAVGRWASARSVAVSPLRIRHAAGRQ